MKFCSNVVLTLTLITWTLPLAADTTTGATGTIDVTDVVVEFDREIEIPARSSGPVAMITVRKNDLVDAGQTLAQLDETTLAIRRRTAVLQLESTRLTLNDDIELKYAETALAEAQAELDDSRQAHESVRGAVAMNQLRRMRLATERGQLEVARAQKQRRQAEIDEHLRAADLAMIDEELNRLRCISPIDGVVLTVHHDIGEWVNTGESLATVATAGVLRLHALVNAEQIDVATCAGLPISVHWGERGTANEGSLRGSVISVDPRRFPGNQVRLHAEVINRRRVAASGGFRGDRSLATAWQLVPGMDVTMKIELSPTQVSLRAPVVVPEPRR